MNDILHEKTVIYRGEAKLPGTPKAAFVSMLVLAAICVALFNLVSAIPYSVFFKVAILIFTAVGINYILKKGTFGVTYAVTEDGMLVFLTKYGLIQRETAWIKIDEAEFFPGKLVFEKRKYEFYPDEELSKLLAER